MASFILTGDERRVLTTWLHEGHGYLDVESKSANETVRLTLSKDPDLDVTDYIRSKMSGGFQSTVEDKTRPDNSGANECSMCWWILKHDSAEVGLGDLPEEAASWAATLRAWDASIVEGLETIPVAKRNERSIDCFDDNDSPDGSIPAGDQLYCQRQIISKVCSILE